MDSRLGYTSRGPHKADIKVYASGIEVSKKLSRGELKCISSLVMVGLWWFINEKNGETPVVLVDDIASELDMDKKNWAISIINQTRAQIFYTAARVEDLPELNIDQTKAFHVEQYAN